jgi:hypothetical protein
MQSSVWEGLGRTGCRVLAYDLLAPQLVSRI